MKKLISCQDALAALFEKWNPSAACETVPVAKALHRVSAQVYTARCSIPVVRASAMDGVAVDSGRFAGGMPDTANWKRGVDYDRADTGDDFDDRFDAVIPIEQVTLFPSGGIQISDGVTVTRGMHVNGAGSQLREGTPLNEAGLPLRPTDLAALAMGGVTEVEVYKKPRIAFIPTGSELVAVGTPLQRGKNYDTNSLMVSLALEEMGAQPVCCPIVRDDPAQLKNALEQALEDADVVIINGGSSKGDEDFNTRLLAKEGELLFHGVAAAPGRPLSIAAVNGKPVLNMAGPALAAFFTLEWCIRPLVCRYLHTPLSEHQKLTGILTKPLHGGAPLDVLHRVEVRRRGSAFIVTPMERGQADLPAMLRTNAMVIVPAGASDRNAGDAIEVELLRSIGEIPKEEAD